MPRQSTDEHRTAAERERADHSKEIRTAREAAIVSLVNHPYICGMKDYVRTHYHWYMLFEYVNGGQMLDYIISHGKLKEKQARKFARQIASALDYCHRNSIVHRDLKIENILISKNGDIKIIDFGLSNLFSPQSHLKTFCGSLYFAAPELLQAKQYTGPEVDLWSFGIVLYVLVCGKVPFDDQSMPQLHAKIKKGHVEYPPWLSQGLPLKLRLQHMANPVSSECKNLISRMLVTDPKHRATLAEIMNHPWMTKGFNSPPENFLPTREPLQLPLDSAVIQMMTGFDFGTPEYITAQLTKILESDEYQRAVRNAARKHAVQSPETERKRGVFEFYKRRNSTTSRDTLPNSSNEAIPFGADPVNAFNPLISIYYLAREKMVREAEEAKAALAAPQPLNEKSLKMLELQAPETAHTNAQAYEMPGEAPTGGRTRARARTQGEDEVTDEIAKLDLQPAAANPPPSPALLQPPQDQTPTKKESAAANLLRRFSTRRRNREPDSTPTPTLAISLPSDGSPNPPQKSFSVRRTRDNAPSTGSLNVATPHRQEFLTPPGAAGSGASAGAAEPLLPRRFMSLRRATSVDRRRLTRRGVSDASGGRRDVPATSGSDTGVPSPAATAAAAAATAAVVGEQEEGGVAGVRTRVPATRAKSLGHARRESIQARRAKREAVGVPEETDAEIAEEEDGDGMGEEETDREMKPVFLKGLFSVSTTSSKPLSFIRQDIIRVLRQRGVEFEEVKGGFRCRHAPSIELEKHGEGVQQHNATGAVAGPEKGQGHRRKISFGAVTKERDREKEELREQQQQQQQRAPNTPRTPSHRGAAAVTGKSQDQSLTNTDDSSGSEGQVAAAPTRLRRQPPRGAGETSTHVRDEMTENMVLRFDIWVVKVPLLSLHGIQFKKVDGNIMVYKNMAQEILKALKL